VNQYVNRRSYIYKKYASLLVALLEILRM